MPSLRISIRKLPPEPLMRAMAAVAVGMFIGCWVIGPAMTSGGDTAKQVPAKSEVLSFEAMLKRPDPFAYRTPTPVFDDAGPTHNAETARAQARAEVGVRSVDDAWSDLGEPAPESHSRGHWQYRVPDRHAVY
jgi:hypothetical protein